MKAPSWGCHHDCFAVRLCSALGYALFKVPASGRFVLGLGGCVYMIDAGVIDRQMEPRWCTYCTEGRYMQESP